MAVAGRRQLACRLEPVPSELPYGLEQAVACAGRAVVGRDQRLAHERVEMPEHIDHVAARRDGVNARQPESAGNTEVARSSARSSSVSRSYDHARFEGPGALCIRPRPQASAESRGLCPWGLEPPCVRGGTRSPLVVVHPQTGDLSPLQANTTKDRPGPHFTGDKRRQHRAARPAQACDLRKRRGRSAGIGPHAGPDRGSRSTTLNHQGSTVTASRCCSPVPGPQPQP